MPLPETKISKFKKFLNKNKKKVLVGVVATALFFILASLLYQCFTEATALPENVRVSNIADQSLTVSWITKNPCFGFVFYSDKKYPLAISTKIPFLTTFLVAYSPIKIFQLATDDHLAFSTTHHATLKNLTPEKEYFYRLSTGYHLYKKQQVSNRQQVLPDIKTAKILESPTAPNPVYGQVVLEKDLKTPAVNTLVYLQTLRIGGQTDQSNLISAITNDNGNYVLDLGNLRNKDLTETLVLEPETELNIFVNAAGLGTGQLNISQQLTKPVPKILVK